VFFEKQGCPPGFRGKLHHQDSGAGGGIDNSDGQAEANSALVPRIGVSASFTKCLLRNFLASGATEML